MKQPLKVAIVHDYLNQMGGAERVVGVLHRMFPEAPIYTTIADRRKLLPELQGADIRTTWMQSIPGILRRFKHFFWLYPFGVRSMDLRGYDLVISSSSAYAKGITVKGDTRHICYCHTPMRFAWDFATYMEGNEASPVLKAAARLLIKPLRWWDRATSARVHQLVANSTIVQERIQQHYGRSAPVIYPPVNVSRFEVSKEPPGDYLLVVSRLVSYKRIDLAVEACTRMGKRLIVIGDGPDRDRLKRLAGPTVQFLGRLPDGEVVRYMQHCEAFLFPGLEDFGITPLEINACGRPVVAYRGGGALDTVIPQVNGLFFSEQTVESLEHALRSLTHYAWDSAQIRKHAEQFSEEVFIRNLASLIEGQLSSRNPAARPAVPALAHKKKGAVL
ncbi:glycosyltransferase [Paenibacillus sp. GD4]|uniref:glycosyltransferase n=1 Tax=Paenibacillus sp. GD4 TaxID=3068890 RepID=UPI00279664E7|nr:glycosyltransferase [Paenibacillus sp. GD4]MDQ1910389.1 glycosyltransferase [Paenibacillus sp. GD4]